MSVDTKAVAKHIHLSLPAGLFPWQKEIWQRWQQSLAQGRMPHALLLTGAKGTGKLALAQLIAAQQLCERGSELPCRECDACQLYAAGSHPHVFDVSQLEAKLSIELIREASDFLTSTPVFTGPKIVILPEVDTLAAGAANALLKTLEEPLGHSLLILTSAIPGRVIPTIRSRSVVLHQTVTMTPTLSNWLQQRFGLTEIELQKRWFWHEGSPLLLDPHLVQDSVFDDFLIMGQGLQQSTMQSLWALRRLTEKHELVTLVAWWQRWLLLFSALPTGFSAWPELSAIAAKGLPRDFQAKIPLMLDKLTQVSHELAGGFSMNAALQFEALLFEWLSNKASQNAEAIKNE